VNTLIMND